MATSSRPPTGSVPMATEIMDDVVTGSKKRSLFLEEFVVKDSVLRKWHWERVVKKERQDTAKKYMNEFMNEIKKTQAEASDEITVPQAEANDETMELQAGASDEIMETEAGSDGEISMPQAGGSAEIRKPKSSLKKIESSYLRLGVVSIALFNGKLMVYACSGVAVRHWHGNIQDRHIIIVTSGRLARKFNDNRTSDDKLRIEVQTHDKVTMHGFLGLYDENIAMVTCLSLHPLYTVETTLMSLPQGTRNSKLFAFGRTTNAHLMGAHCTNPISNYKGLVSVNCQIKETGVGGLVIYFGRCGSEHIAGLITEYCNKKTTFLPTKMLHEWLQLLLITSKTSHFRGYSLPKDVKTIIPSGFAVRSMVHHYLGYPLPPPLVFELNGRLIGKFEDLFGEYWDEIPFDTSDTYGEEELIWKQFGVDVADKISRSVVSIASFFGAGEKKIRYFACTGLLIEGIDCVHILTSASLVRNAVGQIDPSLSIEVFRPPADCSNAIFELYHENYNIAVFRLSCTRVGFESMSPQNIFTGMTSSNKRNKSVVAIGRAPKVAQGLLMASMGELKGKYNGTSRRKKYFCKDLRLSTCQIKKVGIGGPLMSLDGSFIGMNFYDESPTTPFLPKMKILSVLDKGFALLERTRGSDILPVNMEDYRTEQKRPKNEWPVSDPYWCLGVQRDVLDEISAKLNM